MQQQQKLIEKKEDELTRLRENSKLAKYQLLESEHRTKLEEYLYLRDEVQLYKNIAAE